MLCGEGGIGIDESSKGVEEFKCLSSAGSASCIDASSSKVTAWVKDEALIRASASVASLALSFT